MNLGVHEWMGIAGFLLLVLALLSAFLRRMPISTSMIYVGIGAALGPIGANALRIDMIEAAGWLEHVTEVAVIVSLFIGGLRLRLPLRHRAWRSALRLAGPVMLATIAGIAAFANLVLGLDFATSFLLGAVLAPTDPVLAGAVTVNDAADRDRMRYGLSGEAGLNDGMAFPFVVLGLSWQAHGGPGPWLGQWALERLLWGVPMGLLIGYVLGVAIGRLAIWLHSTHRHSTAPDDFLALALIALSYVLAEYAGAWGFLAAFAAGVGLRRAEMAVVRGGAHPEHGPAHPPAETLVRADIDDEELRDPAVAAGILVDDALTFGDTIERFFEVLLMMLVGAALAVAWDPRALPLAILIFLVLRPAATHLLLIGSPTTKIQRWIIGWFGLRGIGTIYYLCYALNHGLVGEDAQTVVGLALSVVVLSVFIHGVSAQPILDGYERRLARRGGAPNPGAPLSPR